MILDIIDSPRAGLRYGRLTFEQPELNGHSCPLIEIGGLRQGPRLCVMAGVHINEASSIRAATALADKIDLAALRGTISIIPVVSTHNLYKYTLVTPPSDGRDLHWSYPGSPQGSFNDVLAHALQNDWAGDADVLLDLHGGDLDEQMTRYVVVQMTGEPGFDQRVADLAACFDCRLVVALAPDAMDHQGRCCTAFARQRRLALVAESGDFGMMDPDSIRWHQDGVLAVAAQLGMMEGPRRLQQRQIMLDHYDWITAPASGIVDKAFAPGQKVAAGDIIGAVYDLYDRKQMDIRAHRSGYVMMRKTTQMAQAGHWIGAIAYDSREE